MNFRFMGRVRAELRNVLKRACTKKEAALASGFCEVD
jgi:hypothetical protein